jgi:hypothetical protein
MKARRSRAFFSLFAVLAMLVHSMDSWAGMAWILSTRALPSSPSPYYGLVAWDRYRVARSERLHLHSIGPYRRMTCRPPRIETA